MIFSPADVVVVGAGPVGLLAALSAAKNGTTVILLEKNASRPMQSRAIGITPPSLGIFKRLGIIDKFIGTGVRVTHAGGYSENRKLCSVDLSGIKTPYPFVLAIPQDRTESLLEEAVQAQPNVRFIKNAEAKIFEISEEWCTVTGTTGEGGPFSARGRFVFGCDGMKSAMRSGAGIRFCGKPYPHTFLMADYADTTGWGDEARLYFTAGGSIESFPLPDGYRRFVLRTPFFVDHSQPDFLAREIPARCRININNTERRWESAFGVQHFIASSFSLPRFFLCGDAAHVMSPIGGQNMNVGFADAECAAWMLSMLVQGKTTPDRAALAYDRFRRKAAAAATRRAALMMTMGTSGGTLWNFLRNGGMSVALRTPLASVAYGMFTMLSLPNRDLPSYESRLERGMFLSKI
jgi:2-polyprenyl-6-methoxyphenol hydroxylase-like FAD-dependent oxidoreductase